MTNRREFFGGCLRAGGARRFAALTYACNVCTIESVGFEWGERSKAGIDFRKHGVRRGENIRIISARPAEPHEREEYEAEP